MTSLRLLRRASLGFVVVLAAFAVRAYSHACSPAVSTTQIDPGPLGFGPFDTPSNAEVPRNFAAVDPDSVFASDAGVAEWTIDATLAWWRPVVPFEAGRSFRFGERVVRTSDLIDTVPPSTPGLLGARSHAGGSSRVGCGSGRCGFLGSYDLEIEPSQDDLAPPERISYAVFIGASEDAARTSPLAIAVLVANGTTTGDVGELDGPNARFVSIAALDQAGNTSARSPSVRVRR